jgi:hydrogenase expression/formation protein HypE
MNDKVNPGRLILLSHGGGGVRTRQLISELIAKHFGNPILNTFDDGAVVRCDGRDFVFTTDSYVVDPIFFPGGDIGRLAVSGTTNDLVMMGAKPLYLSLALILEEVLKLVELERVVLSMKRVISEVGVKIVTGDTKVVERGKGHSIFINTSGIGKKIANINASSANARVGDAVIISGTIGDHSAAILAQRRGLKLKTHITSDVAPLWRMFEPVFKRYGSAIHSLRDPTRGGLAAALCDMAEDSNVGIRIFENRIPIKPDVRGLCELTGIEPLTMANEGKAVIICAKEKAPDILKTLRRTMQGKAAASIGEVVDAHRGLVVMETLIGGERIIRMPLGEELPRIC